MDWEETEHRYHLLSEICDGIIPVEKRGIYHQWCSPWDQMVYWYGIEHLFIDMVERPQLVHYLLSRFISAVHEVLDRQEAMGLLRLLRAPAQQDRHPPVAMGRYGHVAGGGVALPLHCRLNPVITVQYPR